MTSDQISEPSSGLREGPSDAGFQLKLIWPAQNPQSAPCKASCPAGGSVREWIGLVAQCNKLGLTKAEAYRQAWELIVDRNPFPATMGRICPHPCETGCNRIDKDDAVAVNQMERFLGDWAISQNLSLRRLSRTMQNETVAVIGAGPAGLSFAYQMARRGYHVTVYDRHEKAGGMLRYGIPDYRLPPRVLDAEIRRITDLGVTLALGLNVGHDPDLRTLGQEHDVIFVGIGAQLGKRLDIPGEEGSSVLTGTGYLSELNAGREVPVGKHVVVVGGGNTAIDAARSARRRGSSVTILYRRSRCEMPANCEEVKDAMEEGVTLEFLVAPVEIVRTDGVVSSIIAQRMQLAEPDDSGRRRPVPIPNDVFELPVQTVISAISQAVDWT
ncbi:MAG TPA: FAD-dependent oxidoreductase, partial [Rhodothermia bacterium]